MRLLRLGAVAGLLLGSTGCGDGGRVSEADYLEAVDEFTDCLADHDVQVINHGWDPVNRLSVSFSYAAENGEPSQQGLACEEKHLTPVSMAYADQATAVMAEDLRAYVRVCLAGRQVAVPAKVTGLAGFVAAAGEEAASSCVSAGLATLYPDSPAVLGSR
ncbi:hypothetical protein FB561_6477 [Kribbella amoyensis]|uniref:Lipoprotein n=2 Tax=Kribbella amoyensis TaxID=996641 RepID=A0A561B7V4_9ACTN|nr:hypothetical protein FB561_6477 [Kribbella amoyensis]